MKHGYYLVPSHLWRVRPWWMVTVCLIGSDLYYVVRLALINETRFIFASFCLIQSDFWCQCHCADAKGSGPVKLPPPRLFACTSCQALCWNIILLLCTACVESPQNAQTKFLCCTAPQWHQEEVGRSKQIHLLWRVQRRLVLEGSRVFAISATCICRKLIVLAAAFDTAK